MGLTNELQAVAVGVAVGRPQSAASATILVGVRTVGSLTLERAGERLTGGVLDALFNVRGQLFEFVAGLVTEIVVTVDAEILELLPVAAPPVALFVVLAGVRAWQSVAAGDADDRLFSPVTPGAEHISLWRGRWISSCRLPAFVGNNCRLPPSGRFIRRRARQTGMDVKSRHHLRSDEIGEIRTALSDRLGVSLDGDAFELVELTQTPFDLVLVDGDPDVLYVDGDPFLTVRGANDHPPETGVVTVDAGAVSFVSDGADVMRPGIVDADDDISPGELVPIAEESHGKVLAVGRALVEGDEMVGQEGKVVESVHHVGDDLYEFVV